jgi:hypothetical protein
VFTARYALSPYIKQIRFVFKGLKLVFRGVEFEQFILTQTGNQWKETVKTTMNFHVPGKGAEFVHDLSDC